MEKYGIAQFDGNNYDHWKFRMDIILDQQEVKDCLEKETSDDEQTEVFKTKDKKCNV